MMQNSSIAIRLTKIIINIETVFAIILLFSADEPYNALAVVCGFSWVFTTIAVNILADRYFILVAALINTLEVLFISVVLHNSTFIFLAIMGIWIINQGQLSIRNSVVLLIYHSICLALFTFIPLDAFHLFSIREFISIVFVLILAAYTAANRYIYKIRSAESDKEHDQTTADLLKLAKEKISEAKAANRSKTAFLANMSHEIRTPINTILGFDTMILRESRDENITQYAMDIQSAGNSLLALVNDVLDFSKIESGKMEIVNAEYDLSSLVNDLTSMIKSRIEAKKLKFVVEVDNNLPSKLLGDDVRIRQIMTNLLTNAFKYTNEGQITMSITGNVETIDGNDVAEMCFSVKDTGIGIKPEDIEKLFLEFTRIEEKRNRNIEGSGLGLNIVTSLLSLMGSKLCVDSVYNEGSNFFFSIRQAVIDKTPVGDIQARLAEGRKKYRHKAAFTAPNANLLVVDDTQSNLVVFQSLLKDTKMSIDTAKNGQECLDKCERKKYDIIFMDHMMPQMDGIETLHRLRQSASASNYSTPVFALTANAVSGAKEMYIREGFNGFLTKPIVPDKLEQSIYDNLDKSLIEDMSYNEQ